MQSQQREDTMTTQYEPTGTTEFGEPIAASFTPAAPPAFAAPPPPAAVPFKPARRSAPIMMAAVFGVAALSGVLGGAMDRALFASPAAVQMADTFASSTGVAKTLTSAIMPSGAVEAAVQKVGPAVVTIRTDSGLGSGVIYDRSGLVLTNQHVVDGANTIMVVLSDGRHLTGKVLGSDAGFDLAVVKVEGSNLPVANLGTSAGLQVGEMVAAIGNPYGFEHTVTTGVVSAVNRPMSEGQKSYNQPMIQTDAAINPGNSGGPLVDMNGNVVGINTLVAAPQGYPAPGLGFAVPVDTARRIIPQLAQNGKVSNSGQPFLGVSLGDASANASARGRVGPARPQTPAIHGAVAQQVDPNGPSGKAGLQNGDVITTFDSRDIYATDELLQALVLHQPGDKVQMTVNRNGQTSTLTVAIGEAPVR